MDLFHLDFIRIWDGCEITAVHFISGDCVESGSIVLLGKPLNETLVFGHVDFLLAIGAFSPSALVRVLRGRTSSYILVFVG